MPADVIPARTRLPNSNSVNTSALATAGVAMAFIGKAPKTGTIDRILACKNSSSTGMNVYGRLETVSGDLPSGTLIHANAHGSVACSGGANTVQTITLAAGISVTKGDVIAAVVYGETNGSAHNFYRQATSGLFDNMPNSAGGMPAIRVNTSFSAGSGSGWTNGGAGLAFFSAAFTDDTPLDGSFVIANAPASSSVSSGNMAGNCFQLDYDADVEGVVHAGRCDGSFRFDLYDAAGTSLIASTNTQAAGVGPTSSTAHWKMFFPSAVRISKNTTYRLVLVPISGTVSIILNTSFSAALQQAVYGSVFKATTYNGSTWDDSSTTTFYSVTPMVRPYSGGGFRRFAATMDGGYSA